MIQMIRKYSVLPALLLSIFFFAGLSCSSIAFANQVQAEQCCDKEPTPQVPTDGNECLDCGCSSCVVIFPAPDSSDEELLLSAMSLAWFSSVYLPSGFARSIDYPPEVL